MSQSMWRPPEAGKMKRTESTERMHLYQQFDISSVKPALYF